MKFVKMGAKLKHSGEGVSAELWFKHDCKKFNLIPFKQN
jgi:hypothetical protein